MQQQKHTNTIETKTKRFFFQMLLSTSLSNKIIGIFWNFEKNIKQFKTLATKIFKKIKSVYDFQNFKAKTSEWNQNLRNFSS